MKILLHIVFAFSLSVIGQTENIKMNSELIY
jgi:hypothetical protein